MSTGVVREPKHLEDCSLCGRPVQTARPGGSVQAGPLPHHRHAFGGGEVLTSDAEEVNAAGEAVSAQGQVVLLHLHRLRLGGRQTKACRRPHRVRHRFSQAERTVDVDRPRHLPERQRLEWVDTLLLAVAGGECRWGKCIHGSTVHDG